jgi:hypothetical protein
MNSSGSKKFNTGRHLKGAYRLVILKAVVLVHGGFPVCSSLVKYV